MTESGKHCRKRRNCLFWTISSFVTMFSKSCQKASIWGKRLRLVSGKKFKSVIKYNNNWLCLYGITGNRKEGGFVGTPACRSFIILQMAQLWKEVILFKVPPQRSISLVYHRIYIVNHAPLCRVSNYFRKVLLYTFLDLCSISRVYHRIYRVNLPPYVEWVIILW